jgi:hypothetical protein
VATKSKEKKYEKGWRENTSKGKKTVGPGEDDLSMVEKDYQIMTRVNDAHNFHAPKLISYKKKYYSQISHT